MASLPCAKDWEPKAACNNCMGNYFRYLHPAFLCLRRPKRVLQMTCLLDQFACLGFLTWLFLIHWCQTCRGIQYRAFSPQVLQSKSPIRCYSNHTGKNVIAVWGWKKGTMWKQILDEHCNVGLHSDNHKKNQSFPVYSEVSLLFIWTCSQEREYRIVAWLE